MIETLACCKRNGKERQKKSRRTTLSVSLFFDKAPEENAVKIHGPAFLGFRLFPLYVYGSTSYLWCGCWWWWWWWWKYLVVVEEEEVLVVIVVVIIVVVVEEILVVVAVAVAVAVVVIVVVVIIVVVVEEVVVVVVVSTGDEDYEVLGMGDHAMGGGPRNVQRAPTYTEGENQRKQRKTNDASTKHQTQNVQRTKKTDKQTRQTK